MGDLDRRDALRSWRGVSELRLPLLAVPAKRWNSEDGEARSGIP